MTRKLDPIQEYILEIIELLVGQAEHEVELRRWAKFLACYSEAVSELNR
jgi:hypothetical protein